MPKLNRGPESFFDYLKRKYFNLPPGESYDIADHFSPHQLGYLYDIDDNRDDYEAKDMLLGSLQPLADMVKDVRDTFKPYKSGFHEQRDWVQPVRGVGNIGKGIILAVGAPALFVVETIKYAFDPASFSKNMKSNLARTGSWLIESVTSAIRGVTQVVTAPLTWLRIPIRALATVMEGEPKIEDSKSVQRLIRKGNDAIARNTPGDDVSIDLITKALHLKYKKGLSRGLKTSIRPSLEEEYFHRNDRCRDGFYYIFAYRDPHTQKLKEGTLNDARQYLGLFTKKPNQPATSIVDGEKVLEQIKKMEDEEALRESLSRRPAGSR